MEFHLQALSHLCRVCPAFIKPGSKSVSNESVLSTIIIFQIYIQKNAILEKNFEEIFAALPLAQISSKFFH